MAEFSTGYSCCMCGSVAECLGSRTCNQQVAGFNPGRHSAEQSWASCLHTCASVTKQYNMVPANDARLVGGNRGPGISNGSLLTHLWFRSLVCWLWRTIISYGHYAHFEYGTTLPYNGCSAGHKYMAIWYNQQSLRAALFTCLLLFAHQLYTLGGTQLSCNYCTKM